MQPSHMAQKRTPGVDRRMPSGRSSGERLARGLGWFSIGLGVAELLAPARVARLIGVKDDSTNCGTLRGLGMREIASGAGILTAGPRPAGWMWSRVAGDAMDLALLGGALSSNDSQRGRTAAATAAVAGVTVLDLMCSLQLSGNNTWASGIGKRRQPGPIRTTKTITVNRSPEEVYAFWRDFQNLPRFMQHLESVQETGGKRSHWKTRAPMGMTVEWDAEILEDEPNRRIAWRSVEGARVPNWGSVRFDRAPGDRGTEIRVELAYDPPGGVVGSTLARLFGEEPGQQVSDDLRRFKQVMETGDVVRSDATLPGARAAQPPEETAKARTGGRSFANS